MSVMDAHHRRYAPKPETCPNCIEIGERLSKILGQHKEFVMVLDRRRLRIEGLMKANETLEAAVKGLLTALEEIRNERKSFGACPSIAHRALEAFYGKSGPDNSSLP